MPAETSIGRISPVGPVSRGSEFSSTGPYTGAGTGQGPPLIKPLAGAETGDVDLHKFVTGRLKDLGDRAETEFNADIKAGGDGSYIQRRYNSDKAELKEVESTLTTLDRLVESGELDASEARQMGLEMAVPGYRRPREEAEPRGRFSPTQMGYMGYPEMIEDMQAEGLNPDGSYNPSAMKQQYFKACNASFYDQFNTAQKREWDTMWAAGLYDPEMQRQWNLQKQSDPDLFTGNAGDSSVMRMAAKKASPLARSVAGGLPKPASTPSKIRMRSPTGAEFDVDIANVQAAMHAGGTMVVPTSDQQTPKSKTYQRYHAAWQTEETELKEKRAERIAQQRQERISRPRTSIYGIR